MASNQQTSPFRLQQYYVDYWEDTVKEAVGVKTDPETTNFLVLVRSLTGGTTPLFIQLMRRQFTAAQSLLSFDKLVLSPRRLAGDDLMSFAAILADLTIELWAAVGLFEAEERHMRRLMDARMRELGLN